MVLHKRGFDEVGVVSWIVTHHFLTHSLKPPPSSEVYCRYFGDNHLI